MCRLSYIPFPPVEEDHKILEILFQFLELSFGGCGNGIGFFVGAKPHIVKGVSLETEEICSILVKEHKSAIFHTRMASIGAVTDANCHPFSYNGVLTCHNGHWSSATSIAKMLMRSGKLNQNRKDMTDSEIISCMVGNYGFGASKIVDNGVILSLYPDHAKVFVNGDFEVVQLADGRFLYASDFPVEVVRNAKLHKRFSIYSVAKLTEKGPNLYSGMLKDTVPSAWPSYGWNSEPKGRVLGYGFTKSKTVAPPKQIVPNRVPNHAVDSILRQVKKHIGFEEFPRSDALNDSFVQTELSCELDDLETKLCWILSSTSSFDVRQRFVNRELKAWLQDRKELIRRYGETKRLLVDSYGDEEEEVIESEYGLHGAKFQRFD